MRWSRRWRRARERLWLRRRSSRQRRRWHKSARVARTLLSAKASSGGKPRTRVLRTTQEQTQKHNQKNKQKHKQQQRTRVSAPHKRVQSKDTWYSETFP